MMDEEMSNERYLFHRRYVEFTFPATIDLNLPNFGDSRHYCQHKIIRVLTGVVAKISTASNKQEAARNQTQFTFTMIARAAPHYEPQGSFIGPYIVLYSMSLSS